ncbi:facilitated trehalose transporter Tret1 isoform X1 [Episyrphus balteatus]|uniref:facilitated trehalose transporter Tret1 isoform X1 n=1 Tax=Episyrphus balteatus TaxID=286459 RepID=UPI0024862A80|nr:facilitated trehalose transporter Tret1 isoform X1 [Episyrphus balteatus]XP_055858492.1 facilitated trehalose transporter Tret1 isoform X1 [Episyrphus balteatus]XP_055858493.1 facilitated trehalose transporter Tret1 isoform X1 [Episyrphus balteatus]XP_055858494.1 facilitated trehalose transporter Tret1 isoform X1 [Episyrphus balteatus]XP_055858495.1 facilitated trehalose transporter Tret1 isoform X1 [Episyrphus balteatus]XP_055858496.1 facilitated trehalose transporter Tret1 isoform X1 [Epi
MCLSEKADGFLFQKVTTGIGSLLCLNYGVLFGITSSNIILYQSADSPLSKTVDIEGASLLGAYLCLGGIIGSLVFGYASDKIGPKSTLLLCGLLQIGCWFCILFAYHIDHIYSSRIAGGLAAGGAFAVLPIYIKDISEEKHQRFLQPLTDFYKNVGIFLGFIMTSLTPYEILPIIGLCISFIFTMLFPFMPESPYFYVSIGDISMMEKSLRWLRGIRKLEDRNKPEFLDEIKNIVECQTNYFGKIVHKSNYPRLILVSLIMVLTSQLSGIFLIFNYAETIFIKLSTPKDAKWSVIILAGAQLIGSFISTSVQNKINQKTLISVTAISCGIILITLSILMTFHNLIKLNALQIKWITLIILTVYILIANIGFFSLTFVVVSDISPEKIRAKAICLSMSLMWLLAMLAVKFYYVLNDSIDFAGLLWIFGGTCLFEFFFTMWFLKQTHSEIDGTGTWKSS